MTAFMRKSIESLLKDREIRRSHNGELRKACEEALEILKDGSEEEEGDSGVLPTPVVTSPIMESVFLPLELACKSKSAGIVTCSLDSIQKLVAYGHLNGASRPFYDKLTESVAKAFSGPQTDAEVQLQVIKALLTIVTSANISVHENSLLLAVKTCFNIFLAGRNVVNQTTAKATLNQMLNNIFFKMEVASRDFKSIPPLPLREDNEAHRVVTPLLSELIDKAIDPSEESTHIHKVLQNDCFLVLRSLCKLSIAPIASDETPDTKSHGLRSKILSLHLLLSILQNGGETFTSDHIFISVLKQYLCVALSVNGVSIISEVFQLSITLFISILTKYRKYLKSQIEIFFKEICLNILEATSSSFEQKWMVIIGISKICEDPQIIVDIFVNYDCDLNAANIFERLVDDLSKIAQGRQAFDVGATPNQVKKIRIKGLECLVAILKCLVEWSKELYINPHYTQMVQENGHSSKEEEQISPGNADHPSQYEKVKQNKDVLDQGIRLLNQKPSKGIPYLVSQQICEDQPTSIAGFLHLKNNRINKNTLGEFLGDLDNTDIMYAYVDLMDFGSMKFVEALRHFLEGFRLPGEAQKIDRLMEKFASRYYQCNPTQDLFASADTAYVLAYSIIMLTTDLHSSQVKKKMTKEEFIRNNRGINDSEDLPKEYLSNIYEEIASSEIKMRANTSEVGKTGFVVDQKKRHQIWSMESENISQTAGALMESASTSSDVFTSARHLDHVKPMFKLLWSPILAAFSVGLQDCDDAEISQLCLGGIQCAIRISCIFGFSLERNAFIQALARFTLLTDNSNVTEIKAKNIDTIKTLISIAHSDGNYLSSSWLEIMKCISQLEFAQMVGTNGSVNGSSYGLSAGSLISAASSKALAIAENGSKMSSDGDYNMRESLSEANSQSVIVAVDRIFTGSKNLNGDAIVDFVKALCQVSRDEISSEPKPRMFSLIKLVEISYYNMKRIRLEWSRIWAVLGDHFNDVGCHETQNVSFFAVDSLKQLSLKFLEKGELDNFHFQKDFLRPFEYIVKNNKSTQIRDMVVRCLAQMVQSKARNIKSGWKNIFATFTIAAGDEDSAVVTLSFQSILYIVNSMLDDSNEITVVDFFQDCIKCLSEYACNILYPEIAMEALQLVRKCANFVAEKKSKFLNNDESEDQERAWMRGWFPILFELSCVMNRSKLDIRTRSLTILFEIVKNYGGHFETHWWKDLFKVIFRIFDVGKIDDERSLHQNEWIDTTCNHALCATTDVFNEFFKVLSSILLVDLLSLYQWCISQDNDQLSKSAISCLKTLVVTNEKLIDTESEGLILKFLADVVSGTFSNGARSSRSRIAIHLDVIQTVKSVVFNRLKNNSSVISLCDDNYIGIVDSLVASHRSAREIISHVEDKTMLPVLTKYETSSLTCCLEIIFEFYVDEKTAGLNSKLLDILREAFIYYLSMTSKLQKDEWNSVLLVIFNHMYTVNDEKFIQVMPELYNHTCDILSSPISNELKVIICKVMKRVGVCFDVVKKINR